MKTIGQVVSFLFLLVIFGLALCAVTGCTSDQLATWGEKHPTAAQYADKAAEAASGPIGKMTMGAIPSPVGEIVTAIAGAIATYWLGRKHGNGSASNSVPPDTAGSP